MHEIPEAPGDSRGAPPQIVHRCTKCQKATGAAGSAVAKAVQAMNAAIMTAVIIPVVVSGSS
ncbi:hypothetical protein GCM10025872_30770 [Barrientosiimonas endolithica]|uniref:Uncharacterized protein n=1 Tax=Barrientosiimonas endolithica TaxID=1535208 RepID=A0ABN6YU72_9MICO|nr:hypothetical protein GCM10025872_30770 [Barrientosiimonas endolithica]